MSQVKISDKNKDSSSNATNRQPLEGRIIQLATWMQCGMPHLEAKRYQWLILMYMELLSFLATVDNNSNHVCDRFNRADWNST